MPWLAPECFTVRYTLIPYTGASLIALRFRLDTASSQAAARTALITATRAGPPAAPLTGLYELLTTDPGVTGALGSPYYAVFSLQGVRVHGDSLVLDGYFDNENSAVRFLDLAQHCASSLGRQC